MRVLQVDSGRVWRGGQNQVRLLCRELARNPRIEQILVTQQDSELARRAAAEGVTVHGCTWDIGLDPRAWWHLRRTIAAFQPDIIHAHDSHALTLVATLAMGRTVVASRRVEFRIGRFGAWRRPDRIIAISDAVKRALVSDGIASDAVDVVPSGIDAEEVRRAAAAPLDIRRQLRLAATSLLAVNAAALTGEKDQGTIIRAAHYARALEPQLHWIIAGEGPLQSSLEDEIARRQVQNRVHLVGQLDRIEALIAEADVFVLSSKREGLGSVLLTALALGRPVVATEAGGIPEVVSPEYLVPPGTAEALAHKVVEVVRNPPTPVLAPRFTAAAMASGVLEVYGALL